MESGESGLRNPHFSSDPVGPFLEEAEFHDPGQPGLESFWNLGFV